MADESLIIRPEPQRWRLLLGHDTSARARRFREQLGLPVDRPVVMTGHQAQFWHPGILAKYLAADVFAGRASAEVAWIVVDQERPNGFEVRYPVRRAEGHLGVNIATFVGGNRDPGEYVGWNERSNAGDAHLLSSVEEGLAAIGRALERRPSEPRTSARRQTEALQDLIAPLLRHRGRPPFVLATELNRTDLFRSLVERMGREPERCVRAYNAAADVHPDAGIRPLLADEIQDRWELPLWRLPDSSHFVPPPREHVYAEDLPRIPVHELAPKALFMTGLLRLAGCDLFIHGMGGAGDEHGGYDRITEGWLHAWLGDEARLAPITLVTATVRLAIPHETIPMPEDVRHAVWRAHHARHCPGELGVAAMEGQRRALVGEIAVAAKPQRAQLFRELHGLLDRYREQHASELDELRQEAAALHAQLGDASIIDDRTWPFPLYPRSALEELRGRIDRAFAAGS
jgi:hypothetical protein